jgi:hypothetical protein
MKYQRALALTAAITTSFTLACSQASDAPTSPAGAGLVGTEAGPDGSTLKVTAPAAVSPTGGVEVTDLDPDLVINNAEGRFVSLPLAYVFEVMGEDGQVVYRSQPIPAGANGRTTHEIDAQLQDDEVHTWRAYAVYSGQRGPMSSAASFRTFNRFGTVCRGSEADIIACRKAQYGHIPHDKLPEFLERVAYDLNVNGHEWAPYGRLVKDIGNNCQGYSCDIICSDAGGFQRQWDVLEDEDQKQGPQWSRVPEINERPCEIVR